MAVDCVYWEMRWLVQVQILQVREAQLYEARIAACVIVD
jgi:hypothetical protein